MTLMTDEQFAAFFEPYARNVEGFYEAAYWELADDLIKELVRRHLGVSAGDHVVDAGGGTGRWALWLRRALGTRVTVADRSPAMLDQARRNLDAAGLDGIELVRCDLEDAPELVDGSADAVLSTYGVLSFLDDPAAAFRTVSRVLRPGGRGLLMGHSYTNALTSKVGRDRAPLDELRELAASRVVRWSPSVPPLRVFTAAELRGLADAAGLEPVAVYGVTSVVHPDPEDFGYPYRTIGPVSRALEDPEYRRFALQLELAATEDPATAERGVNLMLHVRKPG
jgi:ubiquinone/menaquinone biosynthesis C-methylase UbiE